MKEKAILYNNNSRMERHGKMETMSQVTIKIILCVHAAVPIIYIIDMCVCVSSELYISAWMDALRQHN